MKRFTRIEPTTRQSFGEKFKWRVIVKRFKTEDGLTHEFTTIGDIGERCGAVIALTPDNHVVTTYEFRAGPERWMHELPGGEFKKNETNEEAARRELEEETGYQPGAMTYLGQSCGHAYSNITFHYFLAINCIPTTRGTHRDTAEVDQGIETRLISISELIDNAMQDRMSDPHAVLMAYEQLKDVEEKYAVANR